VSGPVRTCAGCRARLEKAGLLRLVAGEDGVLCPDVSAREETRGAYVCPSFACVEQALKKGGLARSFKRQVRPQDPRELARKIAAALGQAARREAEHGRRGGGERQDLGGELGVVSGEARAWRIAAWVRQADELSAEAEAAGDGTRRGPTRGSTKTKP